MCVCVCVCVCDERVFIRECESANGREKDKRLSKTLKFLKFLKFLMVKTILGNEGYDKLSDEADNKINDKMIYRSTASWLDVRM